MPSKTDIKNLKIGIAYETGDELLTRKFIEKQKELNAIHITASIVLSLDQQIHSMKKELEKLQKDRVHAIYDLTLKIRDFNGEFKKV